MQPAVRQVHVLTAECNEPARDTGARRDRKPGITLRVRRHVNHDVRRQTFEVRSECHEIFHVAKDVSNFPRQGNLGRVAMKEREFVTCSYKLSHHERSDEAGASNYEKSSRPAPPFHRTSKLDLAREAAQKLPARYLSRRSVSAMNWLTFGLASLGYCLYVTTERTPEHAEARGDGDMAST